MLKERRASVEWIKRRKIVVGKIVAREDSGCLFGVRRASVEWSFGERLFVFQRGERFFACTAESDAVSFLMLSILQ